MKVIQFNKDGTCGIAVAAADEVPVDILVGTEKEVAGAMLFRDEKITKGQPVLYILSKADAMFLADALTALISTQDE